jgi:uncharacterized protein YkwD
MNSARSIVTLTAVSLIFSIILPLTAFAATEVHISGSGTTSVTINGETVTSDSTGEVSITGTSNQVTATPTKSDMPTPTAGQSALTIATPTTTTIRLFRRRTPTPTPTKTPTPSTTKSPTPTLVTSSATPSDTKKTFIMNAINSYRRSLGLTEVKTNSYTCNFALIRAKEITTSFNHDGFSNRISSKSLPYPSYSLVTENIAMTSDYTKVVTMWINSPGHAENMRRDTPYVCVESSGNFYAYEGWKP